MPTNAIVKTLDIFKDSLSPLLPRSFGSTFDAFAFEGAEKALHIGRGERDTP
jgi:hypothetical protein